MLGYRVPAPDAAMLISGGRGRGDAPFRVVTGHGAFIMPFFIVRTGGPEHEVYSEEVLKDDPSLAPEARIEFQARQYLKILEDFIRRFPNQWLWENKRWKYCWDRKIVILSDGKAKKFVKQVEHRTFSGPVAAARGMPVLYITERCVFRLCPEGLELIEIAPGTWQIRSAALGASS